MILKDEVELLRRVPLFAGVEPTKLKLLAFTSDRMSDIATARIQVHSKHPFRCAPTKIELVVCVRKISLPPLVEC